MEGHRRGPLSSTNTPQSTEDGLDSPALMGSKDTPEGSIGPSQRKHRPRDPVPPPHPSPAPQPRPAATPAVGSPAVLVPSSSATGGELAGDHISEFPSQTTQVTDPEPAMVVPASSERALSYAPTEEDEGVAMEISPDDLAPSGCHCNVLPTRTRSSTPPPSFPAEHQSSGLNPESTFIEDLYKYMNWTAPRVSEIEGDVSGLRSILSEFTRTLTAMQETMNAMKEQQRASHAVVESAVSGLGARVTVLQTAVDDLRRLNPPPTRPPRSSDRPSSLPVHTPVPPANTPALVPLPPPISRGQTASSNPPVKSLTLMQVENELSQPGISPKRQKNVLKQRSKLLELAPPEVQAWVAQQDAARTSNALNTPPTVPITPSTTNQTPPAPALTASQPPAQSKEAPWSVVAARGANKPLTLRNRRVANRDDSNLWIIRFTDSAPREEERLTDHAMWSRVNSIDKSVYGFEALSVSWSGRGKGPSIMIRFSGTTITANIDTHSAEIRRRLAHGKDIRTITLTKNVRCSKVVVTGIPCTDPLNGDAPYTIARVTEEMSKNPLFARLKFISQPHWLTDDLDQKIYGNVAFVFEDPDGSYVDDLISRYFYLFGKQCLARAWRDKIDVAQCEVCWRWGAKHVSCKPRCCLCGANSHQEDLHWKHCRECVHESATPESECTHVVCAGCKLAHPANYEGCDAKLAAIKRIRDQNAARYQTQTNPRTSAGYTHRPAGQTRR